MSHRGRYVLMLGGVISGALYLGGVMTVNRFAFFDLKIMNRSTRMLTFMGQQKVYTTVMSA